MDESEAPVAVAPPIPLFRQSIAKVLLTECPALVKKRLDTEREQSHAMRKGSVLDMLVFGRLDGFEVVEAFYKSGPRKGEPCIDWQGAEARAEKERIEAAGKVAVLQPELDALEETAAIISERIRALRAELAAQCGVDMGAAHTMYQPTMRWTTPELGIECRGEPDIVMLFTGGPVTRIVTVDVKHTAALARDKLHRQVYAMGWDIQGAAYKEATIIAESQHGKPVHHMGHFLLLTASIAEGLPAAAVPLSPVYMEVGARRWLKAQRIWKECLDSGSWPGYSESPVEPNQYVVRSELEAYDESTFEEEP